MLCELALNRLHMPWRHLRWAMAVGIFYFPIGWTFYLATGLFVAFAWFSLCLIADRVF